MLVAILLVASSGVLAADPQEKVETAIDEGIRLIEAKEYVAFVKKFAHPDDLKKILKSDGVSIETIAEKFAEKNAGTLLKVFKYVKDQGEPVYNEDKSKATWRIEIEDFGQDELVMEKKGSLWYVRN